MTWLDIIIKPLHTEKSYILRNEEKKTYVFEVNKKANKQEVSLAIQMIYGIVPEKVNIVNRKATAVRTGTRNPGMSKHKKIAYVILAKGQDIAIEEKDAKEVSSNKVEKEIKLEKKEEKKVKASKGTLTKVVKTSPKAK